MLPIKDTVRSRTFPIVNWLIIVLNALVFFFMLRMPNTQLDRFILTWGLIPSHIHLTSPLTLIPFLTHMFIHGGWLHIIGNLWVLFIFGDNVEDRLGSGRYLIFYLLGGIVAGTLQVVMSPGSDAPAIGASGAIAAVLGAYFLFYPRAKVLTLIPIFIIPWFVNLPAVIFLGFWFLTQLFSGVASLGSAAAASGGIAWWAHIGGFLFGLILAKPFTIGQRRSTWYPDQYYPY